MPWVELIQLVGKNPPTNREANEVLRYLARRAKLRLYSDENFPEKAVGVLREMGARVTTARDVARLGHPDESHASFALKNHLVLVSCDRDFLNERRFPLISCPAIFVFDFGNRSVAEIRQAFRCLGSAFRTPRFYDKWIKVDAHRDGWTEHARFLNGTTSHARFRMCRGIIQEWIDPEV